MQLWFLVELGFFKGIPSPNCYGLNPLNEDESSKNRYSPRELLVILFISAVLLLGLAARQLGIITRINGESMAAPNSAHLSSASVEQVLQDAIRSKAQLGIFGSWGVSREPALNGSIVCRMVERTPNDDIAKLALVFASDHPHSVSVVLMRPRWGSPGTKQGQTITVWSAVGRATGIKRFSTTYTVVQNGLAVVGTARPASVLRLVRAIKRGNISSWGLRADELGVDEKVPMEGFSSAAMSLINCARTIGVDLSDQ